MSACEPIKATLSALLARGLAGSPVHIARELYKYPSTPSFPAHNTAPSSQQKIPSTKNTRAIVYRRSADRADRKDGEAAQRRRAISVRRSRLPRRAVGCRPLLLGQSPGQGEEGSGEGHGVQPRPRRRPRPLGVP